MPLFMRGPTSLYERGRRRCGELDNHSDESINHLEGLAPGCVTVKKPAP
jgi:hypothetical protein